MDLVCLLSALIFRESNKVSGIWRRRVWMRFLFDFEMIILSTYFLSFHWLSPPSIAPSLWARVRKRASLKCGHAVMHTSIMSLLEEKYRNNVAYILLAKSFKYNFLLILVHSRTMLAYIFHIYFIYFCGVLCSFVLQYSFKLQSLEIIAVFKSVVFKGNKGFKNN